MNNERWENIAAFKLDEALAEYPFSTRLAKENNWTKNFTAKAINEYKKFMYLASISETMVSPSEVVDVVWHQHLVFTRSYNDFCELLGKQVQHLPSTRNKDDIARFRLAKERTMALYKEHFGEPPGDIWASTGMLEGLQLAKAGIKNRTFVIIGLLSFAILALPFYFLLRPWYITIDNPDFLTGFGIVAAGAFILLEIYNWRYFSNIARSIPRNSFIYQLEPAELVYLQSGSKKNPVHGIMDELLREEKVIVYGDRTLEVNNIHGDSIEKRQVLATLNEAGNTSYPKLLKVLIRKPVFTSIYDCIRSLRKYFLRSRAFARIFYLNFAVLAVVLLLGFTRCVTGVLRDRPVTYISIVLVVLAIASAFYLYRLSRFMFSTVIPGLYKNELVPASSANDPQWQYFMYGTAALLPVFIPMVNYADRRFSNAGSDGSGGGCGSSCGSSCGGGCGGCGGD